MMPLQPRQFAAIARIAEAEAGLWLPDSKTAFTASRLQRRMRATNCATFDNYLRLLEDGGATGAAERDLMISALTTNVTSLWREAHHFELLARRLPDLAERADAVRRPLRIWSAGCSSGAEPVSIAATCIHALGQKRGNAVEILATDIDADILTKAAAFIGTCDLGDAMRQGPWDMPGRRGRPAPETFEGIRLRRHNLTGPAPGMGPFDVIFCRNVTIYFTKRIQHAVQTTLLSALRPGGLLFLGHSERLIAGEDRVRHLDLTSFEHIGGIVRETA